MLLLLGAVLAGLSWLEAEPGQQEAGFEILEAWYEAPVTNGRGPFRNGTSLTQADPGVPVDVAPVLYLGARYVTSLPGEGTLAWNATVQISKVNGDGRKWWAESRPLAMTGGGDEATLELPLAAIVAEARTLDAEANLPGRLEIQVILQHVAGLHLPDGYATTTRQATLTLTPAETVVLTQLAGDSASYPRTVPKTAPALPLLLLAASAACTPATAWLRSRLPPWSRATSVTVVEARGLNIPSRAAEATLDALLAAARRTGETVVVDTELGAAYLANPVPLVAPLDDRAGAPPTPRRQTFRPADATRPRQRFLQRHLPQWHAIKRPPP